MFNLGRLLPTFTRAQPTISRRERIAQAMYASWSKRNGNVQQWKDICAMSPKWDGILLGWMSDADAAIRALPVTEDLATLFDEAEQPLNDENDMGTMAYNRGLAKGLEIAKAWHQAMIDGL